MDNWLIIEMIAQERVRERLRELDGRRRPPEATGRPRWRRALASALVRTGLVLDPRAGEGLRRLEVSTVPGKAGRWA